MKPKHILTRPKEPGFKIDQVVGSASVQSTTKIEEEMMPKMPKFKAQSLGKKVLFQPSLVPILGVLIPKNIYIFSI